MNKFVKEFKLTKKSKTIKKPAIDTSLANEKPINPVINNNPEGNYLSKNIYDKELLDILHARNKWRPYLMGIHFKVKIDHDSLKYFLE